MGRKWEWHVLVVVVNCCSFGDGKKLCIYKGLTIFGIGIALRSRNAMGYCLHSKVSEPAHTPFAPICIHDGGKADGGDRSENEKVLGQ